MGTLVVVDEVAVGHVGQALAVAVLAALGGHHLVCDQVGQEGGSGGGREAHVRGLHRRWLKGKYLVPGSLQQARHSVEKSAPEPHSDSSHIRRAA